MFSEEENTSDTYVPTVFDLICLSVSERSSYPLLKVFAKLFFKKLAPVHRAERWSLSAESETPLFPPKRHERVNFSGAERGETHKWGFPLTEMKVTLC